MFWLPIKSCRSGATFPRYASDGAIGLDLHAYISESIFEIPPLGRCTIPVGVAVAIPEGFYGRIAPRSGLAIRDGIGVLAGVIDSDYRGEISVVLINHDPLYSVRLQHGDRIAQLIIEQAARPGLRICSELPATERGENGYGSTGQ